MQHCLLLLVGWVHCQISAKLLPWHTRGSKVVVPRAERLTAVQDRTECQLSDSITFWSPVCVQHGALIQPTQAWGELSTLHLQVLTIEPKSEWRWELSLRKGRPSANWCGCLSSLNDNAVSWRLVLWLQVRHTVRVWPPSDRRRFQFLPSYCSRMWCSSKGHCSNYESNRIPDCRCRSWIPCASL